MRRGLAVACLVMCALPVLAEDVASAPGAVLRGLDKVSGATTDLEIRNGATATFGKLTIAVSDCRFPVGDPSSNAYAHLTVDEGIGAEAIFDGWMIASSPALSALDHPRYDVWVLRCIST